MVIGLVAVRDRLSRLRCLRAVVTVGLHVSWRTIVTRFGESYLDGNRLVECRVVIRAPTLRCSIVVVLCRLLLVASTRCVSVPTLSVSDSAAVRCLLVGLVWLTSLVHARVV